MTPLLLSLSPLHPVRGDVRRELAVALLVEWSAELVQQLPDLLPPQTNYKPPCRQYPVLAQLAAGTHILPRCPYVLAALREQLRRALVAEEFQELRRLARLDAGPLWVILEDVPVDNGRPAGIASQQTLGKLVHWEVRSAAAVLATPAVYT